MDEEEVQALIDKAVKPLKQKYADLQEKHDAIRTELSSAQDQVVKLEGENKRLKAEKEEQANAAKKEAVKMAREKAESVLEEAVKAKKITPAQREQAVKMFGLDDDERVAKVELSEIRSFFSLGKENADMNTNDTSRSGSDDETGDRVHKDVFKEVDRLITVTMAKESCDYRKASRIVFASNPEIHREYLTSETPEHVGGAA